MTVGIDAVLIALDKTYDLVIGADGDISTEDAFNTAIIVSLLADQRADESEVSLPQNRRGWIGNESTPGIEMGSKLWLYYQSRVLNRTAPLVAGAAREALQWLVDDGYALAVSASAEIFNKTTVRLTAVIERTNSQVDKRFFDLWDATGV